MYQWPKLLHVRRCALVYICFSEVVFIERALVVLTATGSISYVATWPYLIKAESFLWFVLFSLVSWCNVGVFVLVFVVCVACVEFAFLMQG